MNVVKKSKREFIILTEGYMDAIALHQYGFDCAVASLGTSLTQEHADMLSKYTDELVLTYDGDEAGVKLLRCIIHVVPFQDDLVRRLRGRSCGAKALRDWTGLPHPRPRRPAHGYHRKTR